MEKTTEKIISKIAKKHGVTNEEILKQMQGAIDDAMLNQKPEASAFWDELKKNGTEPTPKDVVDLILRNM